MVEFEEALAELLEQLQLSASTDEINPELIPDERTTVNLEYIPIC
jgi:hypothetical protein